MFNFLFIKKKSNFYSWKGINSEGEILKGLFQGQNRSELKIELNKKGILCLQFKKKYFYSKQKINLLLTHFCQQLALMIKGNIPLMKALDINLKSTKSLYVNSVIQSIKNQLVEGKNLADAFKQYPEFFNPFIIGLIAAGERSGQLELMLSKVANYKEALLRNKKRVKQLLIYPVFVLTIALVVGTALMIFIVPQFALMYKNLNIELPLSTQIILTISDFIKVNAYLFLSLPFAIFALFKLIKQFINFNLTKDKYLIKTPFIGSLWLKIIYSRFAEALALMLKSGLPLSESIEASVQTLGNLYYKEAILDFIPKLHSGLSFYTVLKESKLFPIMLIEMIKIGEETGQLELMLSKIHQFYEDEINHLVNSFSKLIEPIIIVFIGLLIGGLVLILYLPLFKLGKLI
ncbi:MAG: type II secretion system F family protein [Proteobacteria bacterium]|nr:type II secretion system F family protein [Pseudomonadota bacterium]